MVMQFLYHLSIFADIVVVLFYVLRARGVDGFQADE
jgi:hypothetical protein